MIKGDMRYMKKSVYLGQQNVVDWVYSEKTKEELAARYEFVCGGISLLDMGNAGLYGG